MQAEAAFQTNVVRGLRVAGYIVFAVPNGGRRQLREAARLRAQGVMAGVSDLIILLPGAKTIFVELKNPNGRGCQSVHQKKFEEVVRRLGFEYHIWSDWEQLQEFIKKHPLK